MEDLITVVVPIYNRSDFLSDTIESILGQTYTNLEIFLIDDGSSDNSLDIIKKYEKLDKRIKVFTQENKGLSMTFKKATLLSNGKYIARNDSDDISEPNRFEEQLRYLKYNDFDVVGCYIKTFGNGDESRKRFLEKCINVPARTEEQQRERFNVGQSIIGTTIFSKSEPLKEILPFDNRYCVIEDWYLAVRFFKSGKKVSILEDKVLNYRVHSSQMSDVNVRKARVLYEEINLKYLLRDIIDQKKRIIFFRRDEEIRELENILNENFSDDLQKFEIVSFNKIDEFLEKNKNILEFNEDNLLFFERGGGGIW